MFVDRLSVGGRGVARHDGLVIFIPDAAPHERLEVEITNSKKSFAEARITRVIEASPHRVLPPCPVAGICGGCTWQHVAYDEQLRQKRELVRESLRKFSGFDVSNPESVQSVVPSPKPFRYRNRVQFHYSSGRLGFFKRASHELVDISDCPITEEAITALIPELKATIASKGQGRFEMLLTREGRVAQRFDDGDKADESEDEPGGLPFSQVNTAQNRAMVQFVVEVFQKHLAPAHAGALYDLYSGDGNFTFPLIEAFPDVQITAVELNRDSVETGRTRSVSLGRDVEWVQSEVGSFLSASPLAREACILLDPPRTGCEAGTVAKLLTSRPRLVVYVSCHPVTLARDLREFCTAGYSLLEVQPFDMFPQTDHVETVAILARDS